MKKKPTTPLCKPLRILSQVRCTEGSENKQIEVVIDDG